MTTTVDVSKILEDVIVEPTNVNVPKVLELVPISPKKVNAPKILAYMIVKLHVDPPPRRVASIDTNLMRP